MPAVRSRDDRPIEAVMLSAVGGFLDAYTYLARGHVFANAQTGNVVLFGVEAAAGEWAAALRHLPPVAAFVAGMATVEWLARSRGRRGLHRPARVVVGLECVVFLTSGLVPSSTPDILPAMAITWAATLQVGTFRRVGDAQYNTTFTTGNIRSLVSAAAGRLADGDRAAGREARTLVSVVGAFAGGAVLGGVVTIAIGHWAVLVVIPGLLAVLVSIGLATRHLEQPGPEER